MFWPLLSKGYEVWLTAKCLYQGEGPCYFLFETVYKIIIVLFLIIDCGTDLSVLELYLLVCMKRLESKEQEIYNFSGVFKGNPTKQAQDDI